MWRGRDLSRPYRTNNKKMNNTKIHSQQPFPMEAANHHCIRFDVMEMVNGDERYVCTMTMPCNQLWAVPQEEFRDFVIRKRPSMAHRDFRIAL